MPARLHTIGPLLALALVACEVPRDSEGTLERARAGPLVVGAVAAPPLLEPSAEGASGPEAELIRRFARRLGADVEWRWGPLDEHMKALAAFELHLVAAGLTTESPWKAEVGFTRPWRIDGDRRHVLAVPPGENAFLTALERVIVEDTVQPR